MLVLLKGTFFLLGLVFGLLSLLDSPTSKVAFDEIASQYPSVQWQRSARWCVDGKFYTSSGIEQVIGQVLNTNMGGNRMFLSPKVWYNGFCMVWHSPFRGPCPNWWEHPVVVCSFWLLRSPWFFWQCPCLLGESDFAVVSHCFVVKSCRIMKIH